MSCGKGNDSPGPLCQFCFVVPGVAGEAAKASFPFAPATHTFPLGNELSTKRADILVPQFEENFPFGLRHVIRSLTLAQFPQLALIGWFIAHHAINSSTVQRWPLISTSVAGATRNIWRTRKKLYHAKWIANAAFRLSHFFEYAFVKPDNLQSHREVLPLEAQRADLGSMASASYGFWNCCYH